MPMAQSGLPHALPSEALYLLRSTTPNLLTWPALPQCHGHEAPHLQAASGFPGLIVNSATARASIAQPVDDRSLERLALAYLQRQTAVAALAAEDAAGLAEVLHMAPQQAAGSVLVSQLLGPVSLSMLLTDQASRPLAYDPALREALMQHLALRVGWLVGRLQALAGEVIICLDEPFLTALGSPFAPFEWDDGIDLIEQVFAGTTACRGVVLPSGGGWHAAYAEATWLLLDTSVELVLLDIYAATSDVQMALFTRAAERLAAFLARAGVLVWGLIPADADALQRETLEHLADRFEELLTHLAALGLSREAVVQASVISTTGSLAALPVALAEEALRLCAAVSARLRARYVDPAPAAARPPKPSPDPLPGTSAS